MSEKKRARADDAKAIWVTLPKPTCAIVREALLAQGFDVPGVREIRKWKKRDNWPVPAVEPSNPVREQTEPAEVKRAVLRPKATNQAIIEVFAQKLGEALASPELFQALLDQIEKSRKEWDEADSDEARMQQTAMAAMFAAKNIFASLGVLGPYLVAEATEGVGKCFQSVSAGLVTATSPIEQIIAVRTAGMKTVPQPNGKIAEVLTPEEYDPVAESFKAAFGDGARA